MANQKIRLTKQFDFEAAHALYGYDGKCKNIHGHSYRLWVTIIGMPITEIGATKLGMVIDFGELKEIVQSYIIDPFDHAVVLNINSEHRKLQQLLIDQGHQVLGVEYQPTSENMLIHFSEIIIPLLPKNVQLHNLKLQETNSSVASWYASDQ